MRHAHPAAVPGLRRLEALGQSEVQHLDDPVRPHHDVGRLQIAMDDPLSVRGLERLDDLPGNRQRLIERQRALRDAVREGDALDELHHERGRAAGLLDPVDGGDVR